MTSRAAGENPMSSPAESAWRRLSSVRPQCLALQLPSPLVCLFESQTETVPVLASSSSSAHPYLVLLMSVKQQPPAVPRCDMALRVLESGLAAHLKAPPPPPVQVKCRCNSPLALKRGQKRFCLSVFLSVCRCFSCRHVAKTLPQRAGCRIANA